MERAKQEAQAVGMEVQAYIHMRVKMANRPPSPPPSPTVLNVPTGSYKPGKPEIPRIIHQVYGMFGDGKPISEIPVFHKNTQLTKEFCQKNGIEYRMWDLSEATRLIKRMGPQFEEIFWSKRFETQPILRADFIRYTILYVYGGIYVDADIHPLRSLDRLFKMPYFFATWADDKTMRPYNALLGTYKRNPLYVKILKETWRSFNEKVKMEIYDTWKGRFVFQTTGHFMLKRVLKTVKPPNILNDILVIYGKGRTKPIGNPKTALFEDANASVWFGGSGK